MANSKDIRLGGPAEAEELCEIINAAYRPKESFLYHGPRIRPAELISKMEHGAVLVLPDNGTVAGCVYVERTGTLGYFGLLAVAPHAQGRGVARVLVSAAEDWCREQGCDAVEIEVVNLREELPAFYRKLGYVQSGTRPFEDEKLLVACHFLLLRKAIA